MGTDNELVPAYVPSPGEILKMELDARGWTQGEFAEIIDKPEQAVSQIINARKQITPETALRIAKALGTSAELWNNLESDYRLHLAQAQTKKKEMSDIERRSRIHELAPVRELTRRNWIPQTNDLDQLEGNVCSFLNISSLHEMPSLAVNFRQSERLEPEVAAQICWVRRVEQLVRAQEQLDATMAPNEALVKQLLTLTRQEGDVARVPQLLQAYGIHFVIVPPLAKAFIDGATFEVDGRRVIALTLRIKRIDSFWFTLFHELAHILLGHNGYNIDLDLESGDVRNEHEQAANQQAGDWLIPSQELRAFVHRHPGKLYRNRAEEFAQRIGRHPGIVAGRLKRDHVWEWKWHHSLQIDIDNYLSNWFDDNTVLQT